MNTGVFDTTDDSFDTIATTGEALSGANKYSGAALVGRGLHSFLFPLNLSLLCPFQLNFRYFLCPPSDPNKPADVSQSCSS
jgi:hypothetical protein